MKEIFTYLCEDCGYELKTSPYGITHTALVSFTTSSAINAGK